MMIQVSNKILVISIVISLIVGLVVGYLLVPPSAPEFRLPSQIPIGYVHSATVQVPLAAPAVEMFVEDINRFCDESGIPVTFVVWEENAEETATKARERIETLLGRGAQIIVGPAWSSHCKASLPLISDRKIPIISCCSSSTELAIAGDYLFRVAPDTSKQALVFRRMFLDANVKAVIPVYVEEDYSVDLLASITEILPEGIQMFESIPLDPEKKEFIGEFATVDAEYKEVLTTYQRDEVAIALISADGGSLYAPILNSMMEYPELMNAKGRVFGADVGGASGVIEYAKASASQVEFIAYSPAAAVGSANYKAWRTRFVEKAGFEPEYHGFNTYDALWIAALSVLAAKEYNGEAIAKVVPGIAANYYGITGWTLLNEAGDRTHPMFTMLRVVEGQWEVAGIYDGATDSILPPPA